MALIKKFNTPFGVPAEYHRITHADYDCNREVLTITVQSYVSEQARDEAASPIWTEYVQIPFSDFQQDPRVTLYTLLTHYVNSHLVGAQPSSDVVVPQVDSGLIPIADITTPQANTPMF